VWVLVNAFPEFETDGSVAKVVVTFVDITKRKQAEETLKKSEHEKSLIMDNMSELIVYRNKDMETIWASKSVSKFLNITPKENNWSCLL